jgi:hypothetical protein
VSFSDLLAAADCTARKILGETITYASSSGESVDVQGVFDRAYVLGDAGQADVSSSGPAVFLSLSDLPSDPSDDDARVTVGATNYTIREAKPDGLGGVLLLLHKA